jgi:hypothetical protein
VQLKQNTASGSSASGLILTNGCFQKNGSFVPTPLTPIGACSDAGASCASAPCCLGNTCDKSGICAAVCTTNAGCKSGCCPLAPTSEGLRPRVVLPLAGPSWRALSWFAVAVLARSQTHTP